MTDDRDARGRAVPSGRLSRLGAFGRLAAGVGGGVVAEGARRLAAGERPRMGDMLLTPANAMRVADQLAHLRGAAMKLGQMISMDAGDMLPPELSAILARLRNQAHPIAAASIGQVHRARLPDGRELAIKVQYPGVKQSIDADVDNVATLLRVSGLLPKELDVAPLLGEAKRQLHEEADYIREGSMMTRYRDRLANEPGFIVPELHADLTTPRVLAMTYVAGEPIEMLEHADQSIRDTAMQNLIGLTLRELLDWQLMQTDPNFANYRWQPETARIVLLDFGAARDIPAATADGYRTLLAAGLSGDRDAVRAAAIGAGFLGAAAAQAHRPLVDAMIDVILDNLNRPGPFDFGDRAFVGVVREQGMEMARDRSTWHLPPADTLFVQRKISGTALLAARLKARVDIRAMVEERIQIVGVKQARRAP